MKWLITQMPFLQLINSSLLNTLMQYGYMLLAFVITYFVFHYLIRIKFFNTLFSYGTLTRYYRRYRQPGVNLNDFK